MCLVGWAETASDRLARASRAIRPTATTRTAPSWATTTDATQCKAAAMGAIRHQRRQRSQRSLATAHSVHARRARAPLPAEHGQDGRRCAQVADAAHASIRAYGDSGRRKPASTPQLFVGEAASGNPWWRWCKPRRLIDLARDGTFIGSRHGHLLASDDSVLEAAAAAPADAYGLHALASYCTIYREGNATYAPGASVMVANFADGVRRA
jgi:hypothetical protein